MRVIVTGAILVFILFLVTYLNEKICEWSLKRKLKSS